MEFTKKDLNKTIWIRQTDQEKNRRWYRVDATGKTLGRLAVDIAKKLIILISEMQEVSLL